MNDTSFGSPFALFPQAELLMNLQGFWCTSMRSETLGLGSLAEMPYRHQCLLDGGNGHWY
jgi:hypothetical protein